ncbi:MAG: hypothetical protein WA906_09020 [Pacificimonas sp.]
MVRLTTLLAAGCATLAATLASAQTTEDIRGAKWFVLPEATFDALAFGPSLDGAVADSNCYEGTGRDLITVDMMLLVGVNDAGTVDRLTTTNVECQAANEAVEQRLLAAGNLQDVIGDDAEEGWYRTRMRFTRQPAQTFEADRLDCSRADECKPLTVEVADERRFSKFTQVMSNEIEQAIDWAGCSPRRSASPYAEERSVAFDLMFRTDEQGRVTLTEVVSEDYPGVARTFYEEAKARNLTSALSATPGHSYSDMLRQEYRYCVKAS